MKNLFYNIVFQRYFCFNRLLFHLSNKPKKAQQFYYYSTFYPILHSLEDFSVFCYWHGGNWLLPGLFFYWYFDPRLVYLYDYYFLTRRFINVLIRLLLAKLLLYEYIFETGRIRVSDRLFDIFWIDRMIFCLFARNFSIDPIHFL